MNTFTAFMVFCIAWWMIWFIALPFGVERDDSPHPLHDPGAPKTIRLRKKFFITTGLSLLVTLLILYIVTHYSLF
ncbi:MAG: DUF1467 family protein [Rickettsiales bacterium]